MSLLWRDRVQALLGPHQVTLARWQRGLRAQAVARTILHLSPLPPGSTNWTEAVARLGEALLQPEWSKADLSVTLSNHFVRYAVVPWNDRLTDETEQSAFALQCFARVYGLPAQSCAVRVSLDKAGSPFLAGAVDRGLLDELENIAGQRELRLLSVKPLLMELFNRWRRRFTESVQWVCIVEEGLVCAALVGRDHWIVVRSMRVRSDWPSELVALLEREQFVTDDASFAQTVFLYVANGVDVDLPTNQWVVRRLYWSPQDVSALSVMPCVR